MTSSRYSYKTIFITLIAIVGIGVVMSCIRMGITPKSLKYTHKYISSVVSGKDIDVGPTEDFEPDGSVDILEGGETATSNTESVTESSTFPQSSSVLEDTESSENQDTGSSGDLPPTRKRHILLLTEGRSGSTWLSSFFWHRHSVFYVYEPLYLTRSLRTRNCHGTDEYRKECDAEILSHLWACDFQTSSLSVLGRYPNYRQNCSEMEGGCNMENLERKCKEADQVVAKTILLFKLGNIEDLVTSGEYDIRVVHLVRDPRPLVNSRAKGMFGSLDGINKHPSGRRYTDEEFEDQSKTLCERMLETSKLGDNPPEWLSGRYLRISHEEMSLEPLQTAQRIYQFVDMPWSQYTEDYIYNTTLGTIGKGGAFGIGRVSRDLVNKWKRTMDQGKIERVTRACKETLDYLGYETDLEEIRNYQPEISDEEADSENSGSDQQNDNENKEYSGAENSESDQQNDNENNEYSGNSVESDNPVDDIDNAQSEDYGDSLNDNQEDTSGVF